ncbi:MULTISPECIES: HAD-IA family hydrolase [Arsenicicoccus]|uniref:HAD-IA family hydrolase n=1 Tax=Arsenicicoccus bolidensis TaxID=229480 RepID=A0ABS9Q1A9_9MICO|nr:MULTISPECIES: HAD-IA family hydrolase [Arsenicicoccus]MCG7321646.1 HAD-IA family hydrolase [Arsenicicoccus bolidensis]
MSRQTRAMVFDLGQVLVAWDPLPAIAAGVGEERARAFLAADDFRFHEWNLTLDRGVPVAEAEEQAIADHPGYADEIRSYAANFDKSLTHQINGTVQILRELYDAKVPLFGLTNWSSELFEQHARPRFAFLQGFIDIVVSGAEGVVKPDPAIFSILEQRMGIPLTECCFTDDNARNVLAATACGLDAVRFTTPEQLRRDLVARGAPLRPA